MDKLSERLEAMLHARLTDEDSIIREAMELAKRYEKAPVGDCYRHPHLGPFAECLDQHVGQRVRIVLDKEG